jgi:hypothetical protein
MELDVQVARSDWYEQAVEKLAIGSYLITPVYQPTASSAVKPAPEAVVVVFDQIWSREQRVDVGGPRLEDAPEQQAETPWAGSVDFRRGTASGP